MKETPSGPLNLTAKFAFVQSFYWMSSSCVMCFATVFLISRGFSGTEIGLTLAISNAISILCQPLVAAFADKSTKIPLKNMIAAATMAAALASLALFLTPKVVLPIAVMYVVLLLFQNIQQSLYTSLAMDHINAGNTLNFSLSRGIGSFSFALVSLCLGFLIERFGGLVVMPINLVFCVINIILVLSIAVPPAKPSGGTVAGASGFWDFVKGNRRFMLAVFSMVFMFFSHTLINTYAIHIVENLGGTSADMGISMAVGGLIELPAMAAFPFILRKMKSAGLILKLAAFFFVIKALVTILATTVYGFYFAQCFQVVSFAMYIPASVYYVNRIVRTSDRVKGQTYIGMGMGISGVVANMLGGVMIDSYGVKATLIIGLIVTFIGFLMLLFVAPKDNPEQDY